MHTVKFFVPGVPRPQGSKRAIPNPRNPKRPILVEQSKGLKDWRGDVKRAAMEAYSESDLLDGPLCLLAEFVFPRPKKHYTPKGVLRDDAPLYHSSRSGPDTSKLIRSIEDAMTGVVYLDDGLIAHEAARKLYGEKPGVTISVSALPAILTTVSF